MCFGGGKAALQQPPGAAQRVELKDFDWALSAKDSFRLRILRCSREVGADGHVRSMLPVVCGGTCHALATTLSDPKHLLGL